MMFSSRFSIWYFQPALAVHDCMFTAVLL